MTDDTVETPLPVDQAINAFEQLQLDPTCPRCRGQNWDVQVVAVEMSSHPPREGTHQRFRIPTVVVTCYQCGNMYLHNLALLLSQGTGTTAGAAEGAAQTIPDVFPEGDDEDDDADVDVDVDIDDGW